VQFSCSSACLGKRIRPNAQAGRHIRLPGPGGKRFDYLTIDADDRYLISAHLAAGQTYVIDLRTNKVVATVTDTPGAEGVEYVPELKKFYTSNAGDNTIGVVDLKQMKVSKRLKTEAKPDGSAYAAPFHKLYVSDERGKAEAIVDVTKDEIVKTLQFDSETGMPQYDPVARKVYVNLQDKIFSRSSIRRLTNRGAISGRRCEGNHGMTLDPEHHRAFLSCEGNELVTVFNLDTHQPIAFLPMAGGPDVIKFDPDSANLRGVFERSHLRIPDGRPGSLPQAGGLSGPEKSPQPSSGPGHTSCLHTRAGRERQTCGADGRVRRGNQPVGVGTVCDEGPPLQGVNHSRLHTALRCQLPN